MVSFFRKNILTISLMLLPYVLVIRIKSLIAPIGYILKGSETPLFNGLITYFSSPTVQAILAIILVFMQGVAINRLVIKNRISHEQSLVSGLFYVLFVSMLPSFLVLSPQLVSVTFLISAFIQLFKIYGKMSNSIHIFNVGVLLSLASLFYYPSILFIIVAIIGFIMLRSIKLKGLLQLALGVSLPYYLMFVYYFYHGRVDLFLSYSNGKFTWINDLHTLSGSYYITLILLALTIFSLFMYRTNTKAKSIQTQEKIELFYLYLILFLSSIFIITDFTDVYHVFIMVPIAIFFTLWILRIKNSMFIELIHMGLLILLFSLHFIL